MLGLCRGGGGCASAQLLARRFARPGARVNLAHDIQPLFGFGERREIAHVEPEPLAAFLEAAADEEGKAFQLGQIGLRQRHRRGR
jgi:hypothetical protein